LHDLLANAKVEPLHQEVLHLHVQLVDVDAVRLKLLCLTQRLNRRDLTLVAEQHEIDLRYSAKAVPSHAQLGREYVLVSLGPGDQRLIDELVVEADVTEPQAKVALDADHLLPDRP
jgi:hypothetical protein